MQSYGGPVEDVRERMAGRLRMRHDELVQAIFARVSDGAFGPAGAADAEYAAGLRVAVAAAVEYGLQGIEQGEDWAGQVPVVALMQARRAARAGVSLDTVLRRYVVGHTLLGEYVMEESDRGEKDWTPPTPRSALRGVLREALRAQASVLDRLLAAVTSAYGDELERAGRSVEQRLLESVRSLLAGEGVDGGAELGGYELDGEHVAVIARGARAGEALRVMAHRLDRRLLSVSCGQDTVWAWLGGRGRFAFADFERVLATTIAGEGVVLAVGEPARRAHRKTTYSGLRVHGPLITYDLAGAGTSSSAFR